MALETGDQPKDLNPLWPLDTDPAQLGAAHLRMIKRVLKNYLIGSFTTRQDLKDWITANPTSFAHGALAFVGGRWFELLNTGASGNNTDSTDFFVAATAWKAVAISRQKQLGQYNSQGGAGIALINSTQRRRPLVRYTNALSGTSFNVTIADAAFPNSAPIANDICIQLIPGSASYSFVKWYSGSGWEDVDVSVFSRGAAFGLFSAQILSAISVDTDRVRTHRVEQIGPLRMRIMDPEGFGPDDLIDWYGPKAGLVGVDGEVFYNSLLKANAVKWEDMLGRSSVLSPPSDVVSILPNLGALGASYEYRATAVSGGGAYAYANIALSVGSNGFFSIIGNDSLFSGTPVNTPYVDNTGAGAGNSLEVRFEASGDTFFLIGGPFDTWLPLNINQYCGVYAEKLSPAGTSSVSINLTTRIREAGNPASVQSKTISLTARADLT